MSLAIEAVSYQSFHPSLHVRRVVIAGHQLEEIDRVDVSERGLIVRRSEHGGAEAFGVWCPCWCSMEKEEVVLQAAFGEGDCVVSLRAIRETIPYPSSLCIFFVPALHSLAEAGFFYERPS